MRFKWIFLLLFSGFTVHAQPDVLFKELIENLEADLPEDFDLSELTAQLEYYYKHPINLNKATSAELKNLFFLSPIQINNLLKHIAVNGILLDILEVQSIEGFDIQTVEKLQLFAVAKQPGDFKRLTFQHILRGDHELLLRYSKTIEQQKGFKMLPGTRYLGTPFKGLLRYSYKADEVLSISLVMEKDAGELLDFKTNFPDHISGNLSFCTTGHLKKLVVGDFSLQFGQGLTLWSGFSFGKGADVATITKKDLGLKPYASANEYSFLRGFSGTIAVAKNIEFTPFLSSRKLDGSLSSAEKDAELATVSETGLHRTSNEIKNKQSLKQLVYGGSLEYNNTIFALGLTAYQSLYDHRFILSGRTYDKFNFTGKQLTNAGLHYNYAFRNLYVFGELAHSLGSGVAALNGVLISISSFVSASVLYRDYAKNYYNFFNQAISEGTDAANEKGLFAGLNVTPGKKWIFSFYVDQFKFPWLKFRVDAPSSGYELLTQIAYSPKKTLKFGFRFKAELKQQNTDQPTPISFLDDVRKDNYRISSSWQLNRSIGFQNSVELVRYKKGTETPEIGFMAFQDIDAAFKKAKLSFNARLAIFKTPGYNSRIYAYERDVLYGFAFGIYNGRGCRALLNVKYNLIKKLDIWARYALFFCPKNLTMGSGLDEIQGNKKQEIKIQTRYQF